MASDVTSTITCGKLAVSTDTDCDPLVNVEFLQLRGSGGMCVKKETNTHTHTHARTGPQQT